MQTKTTMRYDLTSIRMCLGTQSCPTLCDTMDCSPPGSSVHGDSLSKNTGVGCPFLLQGIYPSQGSNLHLMSPALAAKFFTTSATWEALWVSEWSRSVMDCSPPGSPMLPHPWDSPGKNTGMGCHFLLQEIFPTQGSNLCLLHWQAGFLPLSHREAHEMVRWHYQLNTHESGQTLGDSVRQRILVCYSPRGCKESDTTRWLLLSAKA